MTKRVRSAVVLCAVVALVASACGSNRRDEGASSTGQPGETGQVVTDAGCPANTGTTGVSGDTISIGTSLPQSGQYAPFKAILQGEDSYFQYRNAQGGVMVGGKPY